MTLKAEGEKYLLTAKKDKYSILDFYIFFRNLKGSSSCPSENEMAINEWN